MHEKEDLILVVLAEHDNLPSHKLECDVAVFC
jgi:hypothetical protein